MFCSCHNFDSSQLYTPLAQSKHLALLSLEQSLSEMYYENVTKRKRIKDIALKALSFLLFAGVVGFMVYNFFLKPTPQTYSLPSSLLTPTPEDSMLGLLNEVRTMNNLTPFREDERLDKSAKRKACDMKYRNYFEHQDPEGEWSWHLFREEGYEYTQASENIVQNTGKPIEDMFYLMSSPEHRENILNPQSKDVGIGICGIYLVQHFGSTEPIQ